MNRDGSENQGKGTGKSAAATAREERLKEALRVNLRRRKGQTRARKTSGENSPDSVEK